MNFEDFIKKGLVRPAKKDLPFVESLINTSEAELKFLRLLKIDEISSRTLMIRYYDMLRTILDGIAIKNNYKVYSHEAFTYLLKKMGEEIISIKFDRFRKIRNGLVYYGKTISSEETKEKIKEIIRLINFLKNKYLGDLKNVKTRIC